SLDSSSGTLRLQPRPHPHVESASAIRALLTMVLIDGSPEGHPISLISVPAAQEDIDQIVCQQALFFRAHRPARLQAHSFQRQLVKLELLVRNPSHDGH